MATGEDTLTFFQPPPQPVTELGRTRVLSSRAGIRVSPLQLGAMSIGEAWKQGMGSMNKEQSFRLLDSYYKAGGNFIDTANMYQDEESEVWIGEWMEARNNRDHLVVATKYTTIYKAHELGKNSHSVNYFGNHKRSMHVSLRDSLKKLQTDWVDIFYLHWWDFSSSIPEIMDSLHVLVEQGKVLCLGISDTPAWLVSAANEYAIARGKTPFVIYQGRWNLMLRDFESDIIPMATHYGMALAPWDVLGGGKFQTKEAIEARERSGESRRRMHFIGEQNAQERVISDVLEDVASEHGIKSVTAIALAYVLAKSPNVFPVIGGRKVEHLHDNIQALKIRLTKQQIEKLENASPYSPRWPQSMIGADPRVDGMERSGYLLQNAAPQSYVRNPKAIGYD